MPHASRCSLHLAANGFELASLLLLTLISETTPAGAVAAPIPFGPRVTQLRLRHPADLIRGRRAACLGRNEHDSVLLATLTNLVGGDRVSLISRGA